MREVKRKAVVWLGLNQKRRPLSAVEPIREYSNAWMKTKVNRFLLHIETQQQLICVGSPTLIVTAHSTRIDRHRKDKEQFCYDDSISEKRRKEMKIKWHS